MYWFVNLTRWWLIMLMSCDRLVLPLRDRWIRGGIQSIDAVWGKVGELLMSNGWWPCFYYLSFEQSWPHLLNADRGPQNNELKNISEVDHSIKHLTIQWEVLLLLLGRAFASELSLEIQSRKGSRDEWHSPLRDQLSLLNNQHFLRNVFHLFKRTNDATGHHLLSG